MAVVLLVNIYYKSGPSQSCAYCIFAKSSNSNFQFTLLFESWIGNFPKTLLMVTHIKMHKLLQVCKQICSQAVDKLCSHYFVPSCCNKFETSC
jgi:hypothetical protein